MPGNGNGCGPGALLGELTPNNQRKGKQDDKRELEKKGKDKRGWGRFFLD